MWIRPTESSSSSSINNKDSFSENIRHKHGRYLVHHEHSSYNYQSYSKREKSYFIQHSTIKSMAYVNDKLLLTDKIMSKKKKLNSARNAARKFL